MNENKNFLGTEPIGKLLLRLALPTVAAQMINMLYNIVDRIYIGHIPNVGALALTGVGVCMPLIMIVAAFAALVGNGGAPRASIFMGQRDTESAEKTLGNCFLTQLIISAILTIVLLIGNRTFLLSFGASENTIEYAVSYMNIYAIGTLFVQLTLGMNAFITARCCYQYYPGSDLHLWIWTRSPRCCPCHCYFSGLLLHLGSDVPVWKKDNIETKSLQYETSV